MNKKPKNIEQLYSESFNNFRVEPSSGLWKSISSKLAWRNFFSFTPTTINVYYVAGLLTIATAGALWITKSVSVNNQEINEITINNERRKAEGRGQKEDSSIKNTTIQHPDSSTEVLTKVGSSTVVSSTAEASAKAVTKEENQKPKAGINEQETSNQKPVTSIQHPAPGTREPITPIINHSKTKLNISQLATPHPKPKTQDPLNQQPATSNQSPDPWPNMDTLFTNNTPTPPEYNIQFPNAFTPNSNGPTNGYYTPGLPNNDVFHPVYEGVVEYHLSIFNRRGELIFECNDINIGWDGYINDRLAAQGVYVWKARGKYSNGENFVKFGNVMLIKK